MLCKKCATELTSENSFSKDKRYCKTCGNEYHEFLKERKSTLISLRTMNLESKIIQSKFIIRQAVETFGINKVYISYSGGKDSTVLSHLAKSMYPNILHIFANTTNEFPETLKHIKWEIEYNNTNIKTVLPIDRYNQLWTFKKVVEYYGYPVFTKSVSNAIRTYQHAKTPETKQNSLSYIERNFKKYLPYIELPISDKCCDRLKKAPLKKAANDLKLECAILGILASESYIREKDWLEYGCNVFFERKENQSRPLSFWTDDDIWMYIKKYRVKISELYDKGYKRNGCMYCGFGVHIENEPNRFQQLSETHPPQYAYFKRNFENLMQTFDINISFNK